MLPPRLAPDADCVNTFNPSEFTFPVKFNKPEPAPVVILVNPPLFVISPFKFIVPFEFTRYISPLAFVILAPLYVTLKP